MYLLMAVLPNEPNFSPDFKQRLPGRRGAPRWLPDCLRRQVPPAVRVMGFQAAATDAGAAASLNSLKTMESISASKDASTMFGETPTVNHRRPDFRSWLSMRTRVTASVPPVRIRTL